MSASPAAPTVSVWVGRPGHEPACRLDADRAVPTASTMKAVVLVGYLRSCADGVVDPAAPVRPHADFPSATGRESFAVSRVDEDDLEPWSIDTAPLDWFVERMTTHSSNLATNLVIEAVGLERVFAVARECGPGLDLRRLIDDRPANRAGIRNEVTARAMARFWADLVAGTLLGPGGTDAALDLLGRNLWNDEIPAGLPPGTRVAHKNGWDDGIRHDTGLVLAADAPPYVLVVLTTGLVDPVAQPLIAAWSAWSWQHRSELDGPLKPPAELAGRGVSGD